MCAFNVKLNPFYDANIYSSISKKTKITDMSEARKTFVCQPKSFLRRRKKGKSLMYK